MKRLRQRSKALGLTLVSVAVLASSMFGFFASGTALAGEFTLRLEGRTPVAGMLCDDFAYAEGQRLKEFLGTSINQFEYLDARCRSDDSGGYGSNDRWNVVITYSALEELPTIATDKPFDIYPVGYSKKIDCEQAVAVEVARFTRLTQLPVFASVCKIPTYSGAPYTLSIMGFGFPAIRPYTENFLVYSSIAGHTPASFMNMFSTHFAADHLEMGEFTKMSHVSYNSYSLTYYGAEKITLGDQTIGYFDKVDRCLAEVAGVERGLAETGITSYAVFCGRPSLPGTGTHELVAVIKGERNVELVSPETTYPTFDACNLEKANVMQHYTDQLHRNIRGGFCSEKHNTHVFGVVMFEKH
jgi:hypothetical protein